MEHSSIKNQKGEHIDFLFEEGAGDRVKDHLIILGHGVTGNKERPVIVDTARALQEIGFDTLRFSFTGNGESEGEFGESCISKELNDLDSILDAVSRPGLSICYIGHSMGGAVGVLKAAKDKRIQLLVSLAGMVDTKKFAKTEFGEEEPDSGLMWDEEDCPLSSIFMEDLCETISSVLPQAEEIDIPWLLVHGTADDVVLPDDSFAIRDLQKDSVSVVLVEGGDHSFSEESHKREMTSALGRWIRNQVDLEK